MLSAITILIIFFLSVQVFPVAIGFNSHKNLNITILGVAILPISQVLLFWLGIKLGSTFMHLMDGFKSVVFLFGFLLIGIRMLMELFPIRKGERSLELSKLKYIIFSAIAQGANTFLAGLLLFYVQFNSVLIFGLLFSVTLLFSIVGAMLVPKKLTLALASLFYALGGIVMIISSIYISFFIF